MAMIPMECPKCGRRGSVPSNLTNTPLKCKNCEAPFYMTSNGDVLLGEPRSVKDEFQRHAAPKKKDFEFDFDLATRWKEMDPARKRGSLIVGGGIAVAILGLFVYLNSSPGDPLTDQAMYVAKAVTDNDEARLKGVASEGTSEDVVRWLAKVRRDLGIQGSSNNYSISAGIQSGGRLQKTATVMATLIPLAGVRPSPEAVQDPRAAAFKSDSGAPPPPDMLSLALQFNMDARGYWWLDGKGTLEAATKTTQPNAHKAAR